MAGTLALRTVSLSFFPVGSLPTPAGSARTLPHPHPRVPLAPAGRGECSVTV